MELSDLFSLDTSGQTSVYRGYYIFLSDPNTKNNTIVIVNIRKALADKPPLFGPQILRTDGYYIGVEAKHSHFDMRQLTALLQSAGRFNQPNARTAFKRQNKCYDSSKSGFHRIINYLTINWQILFNLWIIQNALHERQKTFFLTYSASKSTILIRHKQIIAYNLITIISKVGWGGCNQIIKHILQRNSVIW